MKKCFLYLLMVGGLGACIQSEPLNAEADITACKILNAKGSPETNIKGNIIINNAQVLAQANPSIDLTKLALEVTLTEGANISPDPARVMDYSHPQKFTVTSEDGNWHKEYSVIIDTFDLPLRYDFEHYELNETGKYQVFFEETQGTALFKQYIWASGNSGFALTGVGRNPQEYPTVSIENGIDGSRAIKLETKSTGQFGETVKMPIAAGNLFLGSFDVNNAVQKPLKATRFGLPFGKKPLQLKGYYKYTPGTQPFKAKDKNGNTVTIPGQEDEGDIYAVLYEAAELDGQALDGNNVLTSKNIVALARVEVEKKDEFTAFHVDFHYGSRIPIDWPKFIQDQRDPSDDGTDKYLPFREEKMKNYEYNLAVVFTSSKYGAYFAGSVGSTLCIDKVEIVCEK